MKERRLGLLGVAVVGVLALGPGLGASARLSYHEAIVGQGAVEMAATGDWLVPRIGGVPWLEKPPGAHWLAAGLGVISGGVDETVARLPSALAALALAVGLAWWAMGRFGAGVGVIAGLIQATSAWWVTRGRLADADMLLAAIVTGAVIAFDVGVRRARSSRGAGGFFVLLGMTALVKGIGFGGALVLAAVGAVLVWDRDRSASRRLIQPVGIALAALIALAWPLVMLARHPEAAGLWWGHVGGRLGMGVSGELPRFAGETWDEYLAFPLVGMLPWTPLVVIGAIGSWRRARAGRLGADRLLWCWAAVPSVLVSLSSARNGHYLLPMLPPLAVWGALGVERVRERWRRPRRPFAEAQGWWVRRPPSPALPARGREEEGVALPMRARECPRTPVWLGFAGVALLWGLGHAVVGPVVDAKGKGGEWSWYEDISKRIGNREPVVLLYDAENRPDRWDRATYSTPFGDVPPDLAVRLFYLGPNRPVAWCAGVEALDAAMRRIGARIVIGRERDLSAEMIVARSPNYRDDRTFCVAEATGRRRRR